MRDGLELLRLPNVSVAGLAAIWPDLAGLRADVVEQLEIEARYAGYLARQASDIATLRAEEAFELPRDLDLDAVAGPEQRDRGSAGRGPAADARRRGASAGHDPGGAYVLYRYAAQGGLRRGRAAR